MLRPRGFLRRVRRRPRELVERPIERRPGDVVGVVADRLLRDARDDIEELGRREARRRAPSSASRDAAGAVSIVCTSKSDMRFLPVLDL